MIGIAKFVGKVGEGPADAAAYDLDPPLKGYSQVVVSALSLPHQDETLIFGSEGGEIVNWSDLLDLFVGGLSHEEALRNAGYAIQDRLV